MFVVCAHPDNDGQAFVDAVPTMYAETHHLMQLQRLRARESTSMMHEDCWMDPLGAGFDDSQPSQLMDASPRDATQIPTGPAGEPSDVHPSLFGSFDEALHDALLAHDAEAALVPPDAEATPEAGRIETNPATPADGGMSDPEIAPDAHALLKRRRLYPGADTTKTDFATMMAKYEADVREATRGIVPVVFTDEMSIQTIVQSLYDKVNTFNAQWDPALKRLATGALAIYRLRLLDMTQREHALLLWIIEGNTYLRVHKKIVYVYTPQGAMQQLRDCPPEATFGRVKAYLLRLEGLFRLLPSTTRREDTALLQAINDLSRKHTGIDDLCLACTDASIFCLGGARKPHGDAQRGDFAQDEHVDDQALPAPEQLAHLTAWNIHTAVALSKVGASMQKELLDDRLMTNISRWCNTEEKRAAGCAYNDTCVLYDTAPDRPITHVAASPTNNIYVLIARPLLDPHLQDALQFVQIFLQQTFWCNNDVFVCNQAALALAKRGLNIDRLFIGISPGGVGQSLYSGLLHAMCEGSAAYFDPNVWYHDDELRKQVEQWAGCFLLTGQESPDPGRRLREDLFKKTLSGDAIAGRKPYGYSTKMLEIEGWKRLECNRIIRFSSVSERNFNSILRRSFVWKAKADVSTQRQASWYLHVTKDETHFR